MLLGLVRRDWNEGLKEIGMNKYFNKALVSNNSNPKIKSILKVDAIYAEVSCVSS